MCLRRRFKKNENTTVAAGAKELVLDLEQRCCIRQLSFQVDMNDTTGTKKSRIIFKIDEDEILNESIENLLVFYNAFWKTPQSSRPFQVIGWDDSTKNYSLIFLDLGRVERRFAVFFENKDTSNSANVRVGVIYDILED